MNQLAKVLMLAGAALFAAGVLVVVAGKLGLGRLPGDFVFQGKNFTVYAPIATSIVVSLLLTLILNLLASRR